MLTNPILVLAILLLIEGIILLLSGTPRFSVFFKYLPSMFWIYFIPMLADTFGILPPQSPVYSAINAYCLPASLVLLLLSVDILAIMHLGRTALLTMAAGILGIMVGAPLVTLIYKAFLPDEAWKAIGSLSASWIGGSANMIAVSRALDTPDTVFLPAVIVDTIVPYCWMGLLIALSVYQGWFDRKNNSDLVLIEDLKSRTCKTHAGSGYAISTRTIAVVLVAIAGALISSYFAGKLPAVKNLVNASAWTIIIATVLGISLSFTPFRSLESAGSTKLGFAALYLVLASIGAKANLSTITAAPIFLFAGFTWILIHGIFLVIGARAQKLPSTVSNLENLSAFGLSSL
jgi:uncharacterized membrane protein